MKSLQTSPSYRGKETQGSPLHPVAPRLPQPLLDRIAAKTGEEITVETLMGVSQKNVSLKIDLFNRSVLLLHFSEKGDKREIARMASLGLPHAARVLGEAPFDPQGVRLRS